MPVKLLTICLLGLSLAACSPPTAKANPDAPSIILIIADDLGWNDVSWHGSEIRTPHLDRLASEGVRLEAHYAAPWCVPTRAALMSGRFPAPYTYVGPGPRWAMPAGIPTLPETLRSAGYTTSLIGKWHLGDVAPLRPTDRGFDQQYGFYSGRVGDYFSRVDEHGTPDWYRNGTPLDEPGYVTDLLGAEAVRQIETADAPLFLQVCFNAPHTPLQVPDQWAEPYAHLPARRQRFAGMVACLDHWIGRIRAAVTRPTLVIFQSDNGGHRKGGGSNLPLKGEKGTCYEGGIRVPAFAWYPGVIPPQVVDEPTHTHDWFPTVARLAGATPPGGLAGADLLPLFAGQPLGRSALPIFRQDPFPEFKRSRETYRGAVRQGEWKLLINHRGQAEIYNLKADPGERLNLARKQVAKAAELRALLP